MILMPPRAGKSELASRMFPAWHLGRNPDHEFIACSYNVSLAMSFSRKVKDTIDDPSYQNVFDTRLNPNFQGAEEWGINNARGGYVAAGVGGGINGKGAHVLVIDDQMKNSEEADSAELRDKIWDWYGSTAYTRLAPGGGVLLVQCMTGDTPVLLPDGTEQRLDTLRAGDIVATYDNGRMSSSRVAALRCNGRDSVLKITTISGKIVRSNGRHPFLVATDKGPIWIRARSLTTAHKIVACRGSGVSGKASPTLLSGTPGMSASHWPWPNTSDFTAERIVSVEADGVEEVFDVQVDRTENFIANGLVSHNTWWHDNDLAGRLQVAMAADEKAEQFVVVKYPAIAEHDEYLDDDTDLIVYDEPPARGRQLRLKGEALHPDRYDIQELNRIKRTIQPRFWSALYQQNPTPDDGDYFLKEHFRRASLPNIQEVRVFIAWDFAISTKQQNDYTVGTVGLQDYDDVLHVADQVRFKSADAFFIVEAILNQCARWYSPSLLLGFEDGQIYRAIESLLKKRMRERKMYPSIVVLKPLSDKLARARPLQGRMQQGMVSFATEVPWFDSLRQEMLRFPAGLHDDQVDSLAWMTHMALGSQPPRKPKVKEAKSWRDKLLTDSNVSHMTA